MIDSRRTLEFYLKADRMMNLGYFTPPYKEIIKQIIFPNPIIRCLEFMRKADYYTTINSYKQYYYKWRYNRMQRKLGFSIGFQSFGYGLVIPHYGTIVVGPSNRIGNYAVLHTSTCISDNGKIIGNGLYLSTGAKITSKLVLGDNISIGANSLVNKSFSDANIMIAGIPAHIIKEADAWYVRDGLKYQRKVEAVETLKKEMNIK